MISVVVLFSVIAVNIVCGSAITNGTSCALCPEALDQLTNFLLEDSEIAAQVMILQMAMCPEDDDQTCEDQVALWWPPLALAIATNPDMIPSICGEIQQDHQDLCQGPWCCEICKSAVHGVANVSQGPEHVQALVEYLENAGFCRDPDAGIGDAEGCVGIVEEFIPLAMPLLMEVLKMEDERICTDVYAIC